MPLLSLPLEILYTIADTLPPQPLLNLLLCSHALTHLLLPLHTTLLATHDKDGIPALCRALITGTLNPTLLTRLLALPTLTINTRYPGLATHRFPHLPTRDPTRRRHWWWTPGATALYMAVQLRDERLGGGGEGGG
ncbi:uncharacterized protein H6S33_007704 [Morchella sextelata]|uniref:uncharacterized protein n=1 Tax=Morchella sextelata TaxID=1174677 RepID=UPI001D0534C7|nr:uncharacterized protein H6S33_007704 [Morchella sextelata]KAH0603382.1 hypothetical protein H6S33_007704 [Morchella sextelata]